MSQHHERIKNDPRWKAARAACLERDDYACVVCGSPDELQADHIIRLVDEPALAFDLDNLQTLCATHHTEKEKEYEAEVRSNWVNPAYPYLNELIGEGETEKEKPSAFF